MATLGESSSSNTSPRWGRNGEPGSAFSGLSRGRGRGRGGAGGGSRSGRGRARGGLSTRDSTKTGDDVCNSKPDNSQSSPSRSTKSSISPSVSTPPAVKPNVSSKPKSASRRASRATSVAAVPQINKTLETVSAPPKSSHKRRRSQAGKPALHIPPKANPSALNDSPKLHPSSELHTEILKDIPPHLNGRFDVRNDIDALVERVRAVAMDNGPSTPKSHIDWAVDDDDTLPDLDDWGVTTTTLTATHLDGISPIIVDGLRSLPEFAAHSIDPSPLKQVEAVIVQPTIGAQSSSVHGMTPDKVVPPSLPSTKEGGMKSKFPPKPIAKHDLRAATPPKPKATFPQPNTSISLHPSLPTKPLSVDSLVQHIKPRPKASPMQIVPHPKSSITSMMDLSGELQKLPAANSEQIDVHESAEISVEMTDHKAAARMPESSLKGPEYLTVTEPVNLKASTDKEGLDYTQTDQGPPTDDVSLNGLSASMHAPKGIVDSISAPANLSTYADSRPRDPIHTHTRAHTLGRSPLPDTTIHGQGDYMSRFTRSGHTTPRGGFQGNGHVRTHSTPPGGANHQRSPQTSRPVITGDAISRLARTIGKTHNNNLSPPKSHSAVTPGN